MHHASCAHEYMSELNIAHNRHQYISLQYFRRELLGGLPTPLDRDDDA